MSYFYRQVVPEETDLAYLERRRLEDEYSKLKELKRKAEQYAVEAKQTAQRLSAENSKLREDLSRERHHNEITRTNIVREFEKKASHFTQGKEVMAAKMEVFDQEIEDRAYHLNWEGKVAGYEKHRDACVFKTGLPPQLKLFSSSFGNESGELVCLEARVCSCSVYV